VPGVFLTFDDGPDPVWTPRLLELLHDLGARATFFPIARRAEHHHALIERMVACGHRVDLHCDEHVRHSERDPAWVARDTATAIARLEKVGVTPRLWRTPWGNTAEWSAPIAEEFGLTLLGWTVDTHDWRGDSAEAMLETTAEQLTEGAIVLLHDGLGPGALRDTAQETLRYVALAADVVRARGLSLESLP
jgi:peptidoglycan/xylan/chitin deacetylase (PgdA/CDA1 family)